MRSAATIITVFALACFFLPLFGVEYNGQRLIYFSGQELLTGTTFHRIFSYGQWVIFPGHVAAVRITWAAVAGLVLALAGTWISTTAGILLRRFGPLLSAVVMVALPSQAGHRISPAFPSTRITYLPAYWTVLACSFALWALAVIAERKLRDEALLLSPRP